MHLWCIRGAQTAVYTPAYTPRAYTRSSDSSKYPRVYTIGVYAGLRPQYIPPAYTPMAYTRSSDSSKYPRVYTYGVYAGLRPQYVPPRIHLGRIRGAPIVVNIPAYTPRAYTRDSDISIYPHIYTYGIYAGLRLQ